MVTLSDALADVRRELAALDARGPADRPAPLVERFMLAVLGLGALLEEAPAQRDPAALAAFAEELQPALHRNLVFLESYPQDVIARFQPAWQGGERAQVSRLRSAIEFFVELIRGTPIASELTGLADEIEDLDDHIRKWGQREGGLEVTDPGIPHSHWWWRYPAA